MRYKLFSDSVDPRASFLTVVLRNLSQKLFCQDWTPHHKSRDVETSQDYVFLAVYSVSRDGKLDCQRLQFARNVRIARTAARKYARDLRRGKLGERKVFISAIAKSSFSRRLSPPHALAPSTRRRTVVLRLVVFTILNAVKQCRCMNLRKRFTNF